MKKHIRVIIMILFPLMLSLFVLPAGYCDSLVWSPNNPSFGGNPYNGSWLLNSAESQNKKDQTVNSSSYEPKDSIEQFQDNLNRQILSKLAQKIVESLYDENGDMIEEGQFDMGNYSVNIYEDNGNLTVSLYDILSGAQTIIEIPNS